MPRHTVRCIVVPLAARIDEEYLWQQVPRSTSKYAMIGRMRRNGNRRNGAPRKLAIIAAIVQRCCTSGRCHDRQVCLMHRPASHQKLTQREKGEVFYPSRRHDATKIASASASFSMSHSPGSATAGVSASTGPPCGAARRRRTPVPSTRMTTSCARELISFARRISAISAADFIRRARCRA
jgi:hypothetical protein